MTPCQDRTISYTIRSGDSLWLIAQRFHTSVQAIMSANPKLDPKNLSIGQSIHVPQEDGACQMLRNTIPGGISRAEQMLNNNMRLLWEQHVYWTRMAILSMIFELPDAQPVTDRLLQNPKDFEAALRPYYGQEIAAKFAELLTSHLTIAAELVAAAKAGDSTAAADAEKRWYANADEIAAFLGDINPYWSTQMWKSMLDRHLDMTKEEAVDLLTQKYQDSIDTFGNIEQEALAMADMMTQGIVKQFPQLFYMETRFGE